MTGFAISRLSMKIPALSVFLAALLLLWGAAASVAMEPPRKGELARYRADGSLTARLKNARRLENDRVSPRLMYDLARRSGSVPAGMAPPPAWQGGLPATGSPRALTLLIDFPDAPAPPGNSAGYVHRQMFGDGRAAHYPYESLSAYYRRSSLGALNIKGSVLGWYRAKHDRAYYEGLGFGLGQETLISEALLDYDAHGVDFSRFDNNNDGVIDALFVKWSGPDNGWANFWWAFKINWTATPRIMVDNKTVATYVWSWIANNGKRFYQPQVDIHETGHLLGVPDFYDYNPFAGPGCGAGGLDIMDGNWGDHNGFSKAMLGWITPRIVSGGSVRAALSPAGTSGDAVLIMPGADGNIFGEFFLAQYRKRGKGNDPLTYPADGLIIWHVDATLNAFGSDFQYNNSDTDRKLLKLVQADGLEEIERCVENANAGDFYLPPASLTPATTPNSSSYSGSPTGISITGLSNAAGKMRATFSISGAQTGAAAPAR